ncbi:hypothetical protein Tco_0752374 [Tanacetum coccineum]|uniref:Uncharacterized protein n=1 Tax=Tanacetum coccineum TaxID=301880 RepID=A0ABQ4ZA88_9ASTR
MYVNLKYREGHESLHAYFATWRDEQWMMIELHRFSNQNEHMVFEFLLESFSMCYCGDGAIFLEGIEFRAIESVKHEESKKLKEVQQVLKSNFNVDQVQQLPTKFEEIFKIHGNYDELFWLGEVNGKKLLMLSPKAALYKFSNVDLFTSIPSAESSVKKHSRVLCSNGVKDPDGEDDPVFVRPPKSDEDEEEDETMITVTRRVNLIGGRRRSTRGDSDGARIVHSGWPKQKREKII